MVFAAKMATIKPEKQEHQRRELSEEVRMIRDKISRSTKNIKMKIRTKIKLEKSKEHNDLTLHRRDMKKWLTYTLKKEDRLKANKFNESLKDILKTNPISFYKKIKNLFSNSDNGGLPKVLEYKNKTYVVGWVIRPKKNCIIKNSSSWTK